MLNSQLYNDYSEVDTCDFLRETVLSVSATIKEYVYDKNVLKWRVEAKGNMIISTRNPINIIYLNPMGAMLFLIIDGKKDIGQIMSELKKHRGDVIDVEIEVLGLMRYLEGLGALKRVH